MSLQNTLRILLSAGLAALGYSGCTPRTGDSSASRVLYLMPDGSDAGNGSAARPFGTFAAARDAARRCGGATVVVADGTYELSEPLELTDADENLVFRAERGARPVVSAGRRIRDWRVDSNGWWHVQLPAGTRFSQFYVNGQRRERPHLPRKGYYTIPAAVGPDAQGRQRFSVREGDFNPNWKHRREIEVCVFHIWIVSRMFVADYDEAAHVLTLAHEDVSHLNTYSSMGPTNWYRLENVREALGEPGDWYLEKDGELIYVPMPGERPDSAECVASRHEHAVRATGARNVTFEGLTFAHADWSLPAGGHYFPQAAVDLPAAIEANASENVRFERCAVIHTGGYGLSFGARSAGCAAVGCEFVDLGAGGVKIGPYEDAERPEAFARNCRVENCLIRGGGRVEPSGVGVWIGHAFGNTVAHNTICDLYYTGVSAGWNWKFRQTAHHNLIEWNHIHDIGQGVLSDMGGIYTLGIQTGTVERCNHIHHVTRSRNYGFGIYFDSGSSQIAVTSNLVHDCQDSSWFMARISAGNRVENNVFACAESSQLTVGTYQQGSLPSRFAHNIVVWDDGIFTKIQAGANMVSWESNLLWTTGNVWPKSAVGFVRADPHFADLSRRDFRLGPDSPAGDVGFHPFDLADAGCSGLPGLAKDLPPVPRVFEHAPEAMPFAMDFENLPAGTFTALPAHPDAKNVRVVETGAAEGRKCLEIEDPLPGWAPHIWQNEVARGTGRVTVSFALKIEKGARPSFEVRDPDFWCDAPGPYLAIDADGWLCGRGPERLMAFPVGTWNDVELTFELGKGRREAFYRICVTPRGGGETKSFDCPLHANFRKIGWMGFMSNAERGEKYWIDDWRLRP